jgi:predicted branched-subunit amino acid permease
MLGAQTIAPVIVGLIPFGLISGVVAVEAGIPPEAAWSMSWIIFAGASQIVMSQLVSAGAAEWVIILSASVVNLRMLMYSAALAQHFKALSQGVKAVLAYLLTDQAFIVGINRYNEHPGEAPTLKAWYYLGAAMALWLPWLITSAIGVWLGASIPEEWGLLFAAPLSFIAIWVPGLKDRPLVVAAIVGGAVAVLLAFLPNRLGLIAGAVAGIAAGYVYEAVRDQPRQISP